MLDARTAWAIALLLAPTGVAAAGAMTHAETVGQHTAFVEILVEEESDERALASVEVRVQCSSGDPVGQALAWAGLGGDCRAPAGSAVYVWDASAPRPGPDAGMLPTGTVYAYEEDNRVWNTREYTYGNLEGELFHAYVLSPDAFDRVDEGRGEPVRGVVDLAELGVAPGQTVTLEAMLAAGPQTTPEDPTVEHVDAGDVVARTG